MTSAVTLLLAIGVLGDQTVAVPQPRDTRPVAEASGTASIRGRVYSAETSAPLRGAVVMLMPMMPAQPRPPVAQGGNVAPTAVALPGTITRPRSVAADPSGAFEFNRLPAGSYLLRASPPAHHSQYLPAVFGATDSMEPGAVIELKDGQSFDRANFPLRRGGAIAGRVVDDAGEPLTRISVHASRIRPGGTGFDRVGGGFLQTDDHGRYRLYGLEPGEYVVAAEGRNMSSGPPGLESGETEGFTTAFHPSTTQDREAGRLRVRAGADLEGIDIQLIRTRVFKITGTVMDSKGQLVTRPNAQLTKQTPGGGGFSGSGLSFDAQGRFTIRDVVPGEYTLVVQPQGFYEQPEPGAPQKTVEMAMLPLSVTADIENLVVVTHPGTTVVGELVFADGAPRSIGQVQVMVDRSQPSATFGPPPMATVGADRRFTLTNLFGAQLLRVNLRREWALKAIMLGATDITDTPVEFKKEHSGQLQIIVTTRAATIEGTVTDDDGAPVESATVMVFPEDKDSWKFGSPRIRMAGSGKDGKFSTPGLIGGRYYAIAVPFRTLGYGPGVSTEFFEALARDATRVAVSDDEQRIVDLRVVQKEQ